MTYIVSWWISRRLQTSSCWHQLLCIYNISNVWVLGSYVYDTPGNISKIFPSEMFDDLACPNLGWIDIMDAWVGGIYGADTCVNHLIDVNSAYYEEIISKCEGKNRCEDLQAPFYETMECQEISDAVYYIEVVVVQYRCALPLTSMAFSSACFCVSVETKSCTRPASAAC